MVAGTVQCAEAQTDALKITDPWISAAPPTVTVFAGYMTFTNEGPVDLRISEITSSRFESIEMHRTLIEQGIARMEEQTSLLIPGNQTLKLAPQSWHLMLINPTRPVTLGQQVQLTVVLENKQRIAVTATVRMPNSM